MFLVSYPLARRRHNLNQCISVGCSSNYSLLNFKLFPPFFTYLVSKFWIVNCLTHHVNDFFSLDVQRLFVKRKTSNECLLLLIQLLLNFFPLLFFSRNGIFSINIVEDLTQYFHCRYVKKRMN